VFCFGSARRWLVLRVFSWLVGGAAILLVGVCLGYWWCLQSVVSSLVAVLYLVSVLVVGVQRPGG
jgi:hypothetical protein